MELVDLKAEVREQRGKGAARQLRMKGFIPSVLYGPNTKPVALSLESEEIRNILKKAAGANVLINLRIGQEDQKNVKTVMIKEYQLDSIKRTLIHADLYEFSMDEKLTVSVPINIIGKPPGIEKGGSLSVVFREVEVECLPKDMPDRIDVDISHLEMGDSVHVSDLFVKEGVEILTDKKTPLATIIAPMAEEIVEVEEVAEEVAEGEEEKAAEETEEAKSETKSETKE